MPDRNSLHVAIFLDDFYPMSGGIGRSVQTQIGELVRLGHKVTLFAPKHQLQPPDNCEVYVTPSYYIPGTPSHMCSLRFGQKLAERICRDHTFDVVHSQNERGALLLAARVARIQRIPHIHTFHTNITGIHSELPLSSLFVSAMYGLVIVPLLSRISALRSPGAATSPPTATGSWIVQRDWKSLASIAARVDYFSAPSKYMVETITSCLPKEQKDRGHVIPTSVNPALIKALRLQPKKANTSQRLRFLTLGRLSKEKRVDVLISAFIKANIPDAELHIVGFGDQETALKKMAEKKPAIFFHPHAKDIETVASYYLSSDVFVLTSYGFDTQALTLIEAATAGLPIVYCDPRLTVGVNKENSILTDSESDESVARALTQIADNELRDRLASNSSEQAADFSPEAMAEQYIKLYQSSTI